MNRSRLDVILAILALAPADAVAQRGRVVTDTVHAASLRNRIGDPAETRVSVYLPPSYDVTPARRYPVIYLLHGAGNTDRNWLADGSGGGGVPSIMDSLIATRAIQEMIVVMPNAANRIGASWYLNSSTSGRWEDFISHDLVVWTDARFRTFARPESRGLAGASMGGFGTLMIAMRHGEPYGAIYAASTCCMKRFSIFDASKDREAWEAVAAVPSFNEIAKATNYTRLLIGLAIAFVPDSTTPPLYFAFPFARGEDGWVTKSSVIAQWDANVPLHIVAHHADALRRLRAIQLDHGKSDEVVPLAEALAMDAALTRANVPHGFEVYDGNHFDRPAERLAARIFPFFSRMLTGSGES